MEATSLHPLTLIVGSRGGGAHMSAAHSLKCYEERRNNVVEIQDFFGPELLDDIWLPFIGKLGSFCVNFWDDALREGDIRGLERCARWQSFAETLLSPLVRQKFYQYLNKLEKKPDKICYTQGLCVNAIAEAVLKFNRENGKKVPLYVYPVEIPSEKIAYLFASLRKINENHSLSEIVTIHTRTPLGSSVSTDFWKKQVGENVRIKEYDYSPVIHPMYRESHCTIGQATQIKLRINHPTEHTTFRNGQARISEEQNPSSDDAITLDIHANDKVAMIMLGGQPPIHTVVSYLETLISYTRDNFAAGDHTHYHFFVFCGKGETDVKNPILERVRPLLRSLPQNLSIIPFTYQNPEVLALIRHRSNLNLIKPGGVSVAEEIQLYQDTTHSSLPDKEKRMVFIYSAGMISAGNKFTDFLWAIARMIVKIVRYIFGIYPTKNIYAKYDPLLPAATTRQLENIPEKPNLENRICSRYYQTVKEAAAEKTTQASQQFSSRQRLFLIAKEVDKLRAAGWQGTNEEREKEAIQRLLIKHGIVLWERANAKIFREAMNVTVVSPQYWSQFAKRFFPALEKQQTD